VIAGHASVTLEAISKSRAPRSNRKLRNEANYSFPW
jgi:hypothetical protein